MCLWSIMVPWSIMPNNELFPQQNYSLQRRKKQLLSLPFLGKSFWEILEADVQGRPGRLPGGSRLLQP